MIITTQLVLWEKSQENRAPRESCELISISSEAFYHARKTKSLTIGEWLMAIEVNCASMLGRGVLIMFDLSRARVTLCSWMRTINSIMKCFLHIPWISNVYLIVIIVLAGVTYYLVIFSSGYMWKIIPINYLRTPI